MIRVPDLATQRRQSDEPASVGDTVADVLAGLTIMVFVMVLISGVWNNLRSMITGRYVVKLPEGQS